MPSQSKSKHPTDGHKTHEHKLTSVNTHKGKKDKKSGKRKHPLFSPLIFSKRKVNIQKVHDEDKEDMEEDLRDLRNLIEKASKGKKQTINNPPAITTTNDNNQLANTNQNHIHTDDHLTTHTTNTTHISQNKPNKRLPSSINEISNFHQNDPQENKNTSKTNSLSSSTSSSSSSSSSPVFNGRPDYLATVIKDITTQQYQTHCHIKSKDKREILLEGPQTGVRIYKKIPGLCQTYIVNNASDTIIYGLCHFFPFERTRSIVSADDGTIKNTLERGYCIRHQLNGSTKPEPFMIPSNEKLRNVLTGHLNISGKGARPLRGKPANNLIEVNDGDYGIVQICYWPDAYVIWDTKNREKMEIRKKSKTIEDGQSPLTLLPSANTSAITPSTSKSPFLTAFSIPYSSSTRLLPPLASDSLPPVSTLLSSPPKLSPDQYRELETITQSKRNSLNPHYNYYNTTNFHNSSFNNTNNGLISNITVLRNTDSLLNLKSPFLSPSQISMHKIHPSFTRLTHNRSKKASITTTPFIIEDTGECALTTYKNGHNNNGKDGENNNKRILEITDQNNNIQTANTTTTASTITGVPTHTLNAIQQTDNNNNTMLMDNDIRVDNTQAMITTTNIQINQASSLRSEDTTLPELQSNLNNDTPHIDPTSNSHLKRKSNLISNTNLTNEESPKHTRRMKRVRFNTDANSTLDFRVAPKPESKTNQHLTELVDYWKRQLELHIAPKTIELLAQIIKKDDYRFIDFIIKIMQSLPFP